MNSLHVFVLENMYWFSIGAATNHHNGLKQQKNVLFFIDQKFEMGLTG